MAGGPLSRLAVGAALCALVGASPVSGGGLTLPETAKGAVSAPARQGALAVFVGPLSECCDGRSPMAGQIRMTGGAVTFMPAFGFVEGQPYTVRLGQTLTEFAIAPSASVAPPGVVSITPSGARLPENTLRFYIRFATPMQPHRAADFIALIGPDGRPDVAAFMAFKQELWNADRTQLTLLMDPGRIKRGVAQNVELGPALIQGQTHTLIVTEGWPAAVGGLAAPRFEKRFVVTAPLRSLPDPAHWDITTPRNQSRDPLVIRFDRPFDQQTLASAIAVLDAQGHPVSGRAEAVDHATGWRFIPDAPWMGSFLDIHVDPRLEDVAGNNFIDLLDHALGTPVSADGSVTRRILMPADRSVWPSNDF